MNMISASVENGSFISDANSAIISVIPKPSKDRTLCCKYRSLSILNSKVKVYARVLANRMEPYMTELVHHDQTGFIKTALATDILRGLLRVIHASTDILSPCSILSLDVEKVFNRLE